ncbi:MAG: hypothetical protein NVS1B9_07440 [Solirubrobacteraceae bacterium]
MLAWLALRPPVDTITAPHFPREAEWVNVASLRMDKQRGRPVLIEFWDFCRPHSLRTLPHVISWHRRYGGEGLRVISVHCSGFRPSARPEAVRAAVARLQIEHPVLIDNAFALWHDYENAGWPARYLWDQQGILTQYHYGIGGYRETEREIQRLLGLELPIEVDDPPGDLLVPTADRLEPPWSGPYTAGGVWAVLEGAGEIVVNGEAREIGFTGAHLLIEHERHQAGVLELELGSGVRCYAVCFEASSA